MASNRRDEGELILSREIQAGGRSTARINGRTVTATFLGSLGQHLVDIHGQSDHLSLLRPTAQLTILDRYAHLDNRSSCVSADHVREWRTAKARLDAIDTGARDRAQRIDLLRFQCDEISAAQLRVGEETELETERSRLVNAERLGQLVALVAAQLVGGDEVSDETSAVDALRNASTRSLGDAAGTWMHHCPVTIGAIYRR